MSFTRRNFLKLLAIGGSGLISSVQAIASYLPWPRAAFEASNLDAAFKSLFPNQTIFGNSSTIQLEVTKNAKLNSPIAIKVHSHIEQTDSISLFLENSPQPLIATFIIPGGTIAAISTRVRLSQTDTLLVAVKAKNEIHTMRQEINLLSGGCGE